MVLLATMLAGCSFLSDAGAPSPNGGGGGGTGGEPIGGVPEPPGVPGPAADALREEPDPDIVDGRGAAVDHFAIGPDGRTVVVYWWGGTQACFGLKEVLVEVQRGTPIITVIEGTRPAAVGQACTMEALLKSAVVVLEEPILVDGSGVTHEPGEPPLDAEPAPVDVRPDVVDARPVPVIGYRLSGDGLQLTAMYVGGVEHCYGLAAASAERAGGDGPLTVAIMEGRRPDPPRACEDLGVAKSVTFNLDEPLIVQAAFDEVVPDQGLDLDPSSSAPGAQD